MTTGYSIITARRVQEASWEATRRALDGSFYLSTAYAAIMQSQGCTPIYVSLLDPDRECRGIALLFLTDQWRRWPLKALLRTLYANTHPAVQGQAQALVDLFSAKIIDFAETLGVAAVHLGSEDALTSPGTMVSRGLRAKSRIEFRLPLGGDDEDLLARMKPRRRSYLRSLSRSGSLAVAERNDIDALRLLIELQGTSRERRRARGEDYSISSQSAAERLHRAFVVPGHARVFVATADERPLAAVMLHCDTQRAYYTMAGSSEEGFRTQAPLFLVWRVVQALRADGFRMLNLGGVAATATAPDDLGHGLYRFKQSFGGEEVSCTDWDRQSPGFRSWIRSRLG